MNCSSLLQLCCLLKVDLLLRYFHDWLRLWFNFLNRLYYYRLRLRLFKFFFLLSFFLLNYLLHIHF